MTKTVFTPLLLAGLCLLGACGDEARDTHPQQWVSKRQAIFKNFTRALEPMGLVARERKDYDKAEFQEQARALQELAGQPWPLFPPDSNYAPTRTKAAAWQQPAEFKAAQDQFMAGVEQLVKVAGSADMPAIKAAVDQVEKSCKSCHTQFRNER